MSSHAEWVEEAIAVHERDKPFAPENGSPLKFSIGDKVIYTNSYGVQFERTVTGLYKPAEMTSYYACGYRYFIGSDSGMPVRECELRLKP